MISYPRFFYILIFLIICSSFSACDQRSASKDKIIGYVNKEPIQEAELERTIKIKMRQNPLMKITKEIKEEQLDLLIDKKLIIQEALEQGLAREDRFVRTIKTFWEQTLIRDFIDYKKKEFKDGLTVEEADIEQYYRRLGKRVTFKTLKSKDRQRINKIYDQMKSKQAMDVSQWEVTGPVSYGDVISSVLMDAFDLPLGGVRKIEEASHSYIVMVIRKEDITLSPLEELRPEIEKRVIMLKEKRLFENWLNGKRENAKINIVSPNP